VEQTSLSDDPLTDEVAARSASAAVLTETSDALESATVAPLASFGRDVEPACGTWNSL
jgi:hypothetical protein